MQKRTTELVVGDVIVSEEMRETITAIEAPKAGVVYTLHVLRQIGAAPEVETYFHCGRDAVHEVER